MLEIKELFKNSLIGTELEKSAVDQIDKKFLTIVFYISIISTIIKLGAKYDNH